MPNIGELSLYDVVGTPGVAADVSHMDTKPKVLSFMQYASSLCWLHTNAQACVLVTMHDWLEHR